MTAMEPIPKPPENQPGPTGAPSDYYLNRRHKGWDLFAGILIGTVGTLMTFFMMGLNVPVLIIFAAVLIIRRRRRFIGIGILTGLATLLLVVAGCLGILYTIR
jgi:hypothetical protein